MVMGRCDFCGSYTRDDELEFCSERCRNRAGKSTLTPPQSETTVDDLEQRGGWYTLPDGSKVKGRTAAMEALQNLG